MPIDVRQDVDIDSCRSCAAALEELAAAAESCSAQFKDARDKSETVWASDAGDAFRQTLTTLVKAAEETSDRAAALALTLRVFADSMDTARQQLTKAVALAFESGLVAGPNVCDAEWIAEPKPLHPTGPWSKAQLTEYATRVDAYNVAVDIVNGARAIEADAHSALAAAVIDVDGWLDRLRGSAPWMAAGGAVSYLGTAAQQAEHWGAVAQTRAAQVGRYADLAGETVPDSVRTAASRAATVFAPAADDAARIAAQNGALLPGQTIKSAGGVMARALPFAQKIPVAGMGLTAVQTAYDLREAESAGDAAKIVAKDAGGFLAGTAASTVILASFAGGPATVVAVGAGVLVAWGVGEIIEGVVD